MDDLIKRQMDNIEKAYESIQMGGKLEFSKSAIEGIHQVMRELKEYKDLEEQGSLIKLPCKVGDTIYLIDLEFGYDESQVNEIIIDERGILINSDYGDNIPINAEWVVYTKEDAERKIKEHNDTNECLFEKEKRNESRR